MYSEQYKERWNGFIPGFLLGFFFCALLSAIFLWPNPSTCLTGQFVIPSWDGDAQLIIGDQQLCGRDLKFSVITGPSKLGKGD